MSEIANVSPFEALGTSLRFGSTEDGTPFVVGADFARVMDYRDARDAARLLDDDEKGTQIVRTPGGDQQMTVFYEDGIWELIFRSNKPEAKALKKRVKAILAQLRRGEISVPAPRAEVDLSTPEGVLVLAEQFAATARQLVAAKRQVAELEPAAKSWEALASAKGDFLVADAAKILARDIGIKVGQNRLYTLMSDYGWIYRAGDQRWRAKQQQIETGRLAEVPMDYLHPHTGEVILAPPQIRVTVKGLGVLHAKLAAPRTQLALVPGAGDTA